ncbi:HAD-like protein [Choiromyces venosus 120613-1]|uniref:Mitochondrial import inner membrane translocase subunit TIM50 n=1 Tax=Choiromyces venosus 120613-1 TaxID=1336337 RepID=A0A3N4KBJ9_9PEZI|nr:HAD-like protein [Choiromyces venosus 120613-1]
MSLLKPQLNPLTLNRVFGGLVLRAESIALQCDKLQENSIGTMSERQEIPDLGWEETRNSRKRKKSISTKTDERTGVSRGKTMNFASHPRYGNSSTSTGSDIRGLQESAVSSLAHLTQETESPGLSGNKPAKKKTKNGGGEGRSKGNGGLSSDQGAQLAVGEISGFTENTTAWRVESAGAQPSEIPSLLNLAASAGLHQKNDYWNGNVPMLDPASSVPNWAQSSNQYPYPENQRYSQEEGGRIDSRQGSTTYSNGSWGYYPEGASSWVLPVHRLQLPSQQQLFQNSQLAFFNPPSHWQPQQQREYHSNWNQRSRSPQDNRLFGRDSRFSDNTPLPAPVPTQDYLAKTLLKPQLLPTAAKQLLVLDLNGTLVYRRKSYTNPVCRPELDKFLDYIFTHFSVMVWTSAQPGNAQRMINKVFTKKQENKLLTVWARDTLQLTPHQYREKTTVYKRLTRIWAGEFKLCFPSPDDSGLGWDQTNTILMDDSSVKAAGQPYNLIRVPEFLEDMEREESTVLSDCMKYLDELRFQDNVSAYIRQSPFYGRY